MVQATKTPCLPFFNPVSRKRFALPCMKDDLNDFNNIKKMVANSSPNNNNSNSNSSSNNPHGGASIFVVCLTTDRIVYCKVTDKSRSLIKAKREGMDISDIVVIGNLFYVLGNKKRFDDIEIYNLDNNIAPMVAQKLLVLDPKPELHMNGMMLGVFDDIHLAHDEVSGDLMLVITRYHRDIGRKIYGDNGYNDSVNEFTVMKLDRSSRNDGIRWVEVED